MVGDSLTDQLFFSLVLLLGGQMKHGKLQGHSSACNDQVRMVIIRSDLALWMPQPSRQQHALLNSTRAFTDASTALRHLNPFLVGTPFVQRAVRDADILVIGAGHHYGLSSFQLDKIRLSQAVNQTRSPRPDNTFLTRAINYTCSRAVEARRHWGHAPTSTILLGAPVPIPGCRRYKKPLSLAQALAARAEYTPELEPLFAQTLHKFPVSLLDLWQQLFEANTVLQWTASSIGASFLDVAPISMMRPDGSAAQTGIGTNTYDCLHSCQPGPVDTYVRLLLGLVDDNRGDFLGQDQHSPSRFFKGALANIEAFVDARSTYHFESCSEDPNCNPSAVSTANDSRGLEPCCAVGHKPNVIDEEWWPFLGSAVKSITKGRVADVR